jgi:glycosyltransferase involved in cell wall biosynthesis
MKITFLVSGSIRSNFSYRPLALAKSLHKLGHDVSIIAPQADKYNDFTPEAIREIDGVKILQPFQFATSRIEINFLPYVFGAITLLLREHPDLVYIYKPTPVSVVGLIAQMIYRTQTVTDFDDLGSEVMRIEGHPWHQRTLVEWSEILSARYADRLIVASSYLSAMYQNMFPSKPILIIPNGVEADWCDEFVPSTHPERIVFMGSINRMTILDPLFEVLPSVFPEHPHLEILIIGGGKFLDYFKDKVEKSRYSKSIVFTGWLPLAQAKMYLTMGDIGYNYMPHDATTRAASNMKVPQYMARGVVPLVTDVGDLASTVDYGQAGYICKDTLKDLKAVIISALEDPERLAKADRAALLARNRLNWDILAQSFAQWIQIEHFDTDIL